MENQLKLFMVMLGCTPKGRLTEQHDMFFGIAHSLKELVPDMKASWPEAKGNIHIDAWCEIIQIDNYNIEIISKDISSQQENQLFFINLGGYKEGEFDEFHYKFLTVSNNKASAIKKAKETAFYKHCGFEKAVSHIDDKYGIDVDDIHNIKEILDLKYKNQFQIKISESTNTITNKLHIGYVKINSL